MGILARSKQKVEAVVSTRQSVRLAAAPRNRARQNPPFSDARFATACPVPPPSTHCAPCAPIITHHCTSHTRHTHVTHTSHIHRTRITHTSYKRLAHTQTSHPHRTHVTIRGAAVPGRAASRPNAAHTHMHTHAPHTYRCKSVSAHPIARQPDPSRTHQARGSAGEGGFVAEFVDRVYKPNAEALSAKGIRVVTNAGGMNPLACKAAVEKVGSVCV